MFTQGFSNIYLFNKDGTFSSLSSIDKNGQVIQNINNNLYGIEF